MCPFVSMWVDCDWVENVRRQQSETVNGQAVSDQQHCCPQCSLAVQALCRNFVYYVITLKSLGTICLSKFQRTSKDHVHGLWGGGVGLGGSICFGMFLTANHWWLSVFVHIKAFYNIKHAKNFFLLDWCYLSCSKKFWFVQRWIAVLQKKYMFQIIPHKTHVSQKRYYNILFCISENPKHLKN